MNCGYKEKIILYFYGELPERSAAGIKRHIDACASCAGELAVLKELTAQFEIFKPEPPLLSAAGQAFAAREPGFWETALAGFKAAALAGAFTAAFLLAFRFMGAHKSADAVWNNDINSNLDSIEYGIYSLEDDMLYSPSADFDYSCAGIEAQRQRIAEKTT
ncbi:MAG: zf-HC2 domain-containing protein [Elusimicrobia bacterium]|nr:zf-HC2 domain-containing protein [Elusimicrobiota bacterium]